MTEPHGSASPGEPHGIRGMSAFTLTYAGRTFRFGRAATVWTATDQHRRRVEENERADTNARTVLLSLLDDTNRRNVSEHGFIDVVGSAGGRYRLYVHSYTSNVIQYTADGELSFAWCGHPYMHDPVAGQHMSTDGAIIAQLLMLRADEATFLRTAICHGRVGGYLPETVRLDQIWARTRPTERNT